MATVRPVPFPEGVASLDGTLAFIELRNGGLCAIELETGRDRWRVDVPARPRLVVDPLLIAQDRPRSRGNVLQLVALDIERQGELARSLDPLVFDDWVAVDDPELEFESVVWAENGDVVVEWRAESHYVGGAPAPPHLQTQARREARGRARLDLETGSVILEPPASARSVAPDAVSGSPRLPSGASRLVPADGQSAAVVGPRLFYLVESVRPSESGPRLVSVDVESGRTLWERTLPARPQAGPAARRM